jgi:Putative prokaryotic signal transducing protein
VPLKVEAPPPPADVVARGGGDHDWVELLRAENDIDAHLLAGRLNEAAIETRAVTDHAAPVWLYGGSNPWAPVAIFVRRWQLLDARVLLAEVAFDAPAAPAAEGDARHIRRVPLMWWATALALGVFFTALALLQVTHSTSSCQLPILCERQSSAEKPSSP